MIDCRPMRGGAHKKGRYRSTLCGQTPVMLRPSRLSVSPVTWVLPRLGDSALPSDRRASWSLLWECGMKGQGLDDQ